MADEIEETFKPAEEEEDDMKSAKVKMDEVAEENKKLKLTLSQIMKDYQSLKMNFDEMVKQEDNHPKKGQEHDESEVVCRLSLGRLSNDNCNKKEEKIKNIQENKNLVKVDGLELGLDCKFHSNDSSSDHATTKNSSSQNNSLDESKEEESEATETTTFKGQKKARSAGNDEVLEQNPFKKPRVSVRAVCDTQTMNDGCQWRKYGQKISKGNPCPRAYYRCTASSSCPVRKQVQRCSDNMSILITTYEGTHNHPLPPSATGMASATTSAAAMLSCGSTSTTSTSPSQGAGVASVFNGFHFSSSNSFPRATISTSQSHPTVVLDLTTPNHMNSNNAYNKYNSSSLYSSTARSSAPRFNFPSSNIPDSLGSSHMLLHRKGLSSSYNSQPNYNISGNNIQDQEIISDGIGAAAKAITSDPTFRTALAAAITSLLGNGGVNNNSVQEVPINAGPNVKWPGENFNLTFSQPPAKNGVTGCATSYSNKFLQSLNSQPK